MDADGLLKLPPLPGGKMLGLLPSVLPATELLLKPTGAPVPRGGLEMFAGLPANAGLPVPAGLPVFAGFTAPALALFQPPAGNVDPSRGRILLLLADGGNTLPEPPLLPTCATGTAGSVLDAGEGLMFSGLGGIVP